MLIRQLLKPIGYLFIQHPHKWIVDWLYPSILALATLFIVCSLDNISAFVKPGGALSLILSFIQSLPGFYIAALAAIATFGRSDIDDILPEPTPKVIIRMRGTNNIVELTRRRFLAMLFAFLTAESIILTVAALFLTSYGAEIVKLSLFSQPASEWVTIILSLLFLVGFFQMILATFWGLYYLGYKLQE